jgi:type IV pilus assembly protein PilM
MRAMQFSSQRRGLSITAFAEHSLPAGIIIKGEPQDSKILAEAIKSMLAKPTFGRFSSRRVVIGLPDGRTFAKVLEAPKADGEQALSSILTEASQFLPFPIDELYIDWKLFGKSSNMDKIRVLINAVPKALADTYTTALESADLKPIAFVTEPAAIAYALTGPMDPAESARLIIDLGQQRTTFIVVDHDAVTYSSTNHDISGGLITNMIATNLQITQAETEQAKFLVGLDPTRGRAALPTILRPFIDQLSKNIDRITEYYATHSSTGTNISEICLTGGGAKMRHLVNHLSTILDKKVVIGNPWVKAGNIKTKGLSNNQHDLALPTIIGLGLLALNSKTTAV